LVKYAHGQEITNLCYKLGTKEERIMIFNKVNGENDDENIEI
jgi:hypothetical protein